MRPVDRDQRVEHLARFSASMIAEHPLSNVKEVLWPDSGPLVIEGRTWADAFATYGAMARSSADGVL